MKVTNKQLKQIIKEELSQTLDETDQDSENILKRHLPHLALGVAGARLPVGRVYIPNVKLNHNKLGRVMNRLGENKRIALKLITELQILIAETEDEETRHARVNQ